MIRFSFGFEDDLTLKSSGNKNATVKSLQSAIGILATMIRLAPATSSGYTAIIGRPAIIRRGDKTSILIFFSVSFSRFDKNDCGSYYFSKLSNEPEK